MCVLGAGCMKSTRLDVTCLLRRSSVARAHTPKCAPLQTRHQPSYSTPTEVSPKTVPFQVELGVPVQFVEAADLHEVRPQQLPVGLAHIAETRHGAAIQLGVGRF